MLPNPFVPSSFGIDNLERGLLWAVLLLAATTGPVQIGFDPETVALSARLPVQDPQSWYQDPLAAVGALDSETPSQIPSASLPSLTTRDPAPPATVETVEQFLVFCAQGLGQTLTLEAGQTVLIQGRIPYDRHLWLYRGGLLNALRSVGVDHCAGFGGVSSDLSGAGYLRPTTPDPAVVDCSGSGSLLCLSAVSSNLDLFANGELTAGSGEWGVASAYGTGTMTVLPPIPAVAEAYGSGSLVIFPESAAEAYGSGFLTADDGRVEVTAYGSALLEAESQEVSQLFPLYGRSDLFVDAFVATVFLFADQFQDEFSAGEVIDIGAEDPDSEGSGGAILTAIPGDWGESTLLGSGSLPVEVVETAANLYGSAWVTAETEDQVLAIGTSELTATAVAIAAATLHGTSDLTAITFGEEATAYGSSILTASAPLTSNLDLFGSGFLLVETEEPELCRVPCGSVVTLNRIRYFELRLGSVEEIT